MDKDRKRLRLSEYDYSAAGAYFITICARDRRCSFGEIYNEKMELSIIGLMIRRWWRKLPEKFPSIQIDEYAVMPNHLHGIILLQGNDPRLGSSIVQLSKILQWFKTMTGNEYSRYLREIASTLEDKRLWQRSYYDHVIRNERELSKIREYIQNNPLKWHLDRENPESPEFKLHHDKYFKDIYE